MKFKRKHENVAQTNMNLLTDEEYCDKMKLTHLSHANIEVALEVLERCPDQVMKSSKREEFMVKLTSKVVTKLEVKRLVKWLKKHDPPGTEESTGENAFGWARGSIEKAHIKREAREKCRDMMFHTIKTFLSNQL